MSQVNMREPPIHCNYIGLSYTMLTRNVADLYAQTVRGRVAVVGGRGRRAAQSATSRVGVIQHILSSLISYWRQVLWLYVI